MQPAPEVWGSTYRGSTYPHMRPHAVLDRDRGERERERRQTWDGSPFRCALGRKDEQFKFEPSLSDVHRCEFVRREESTTFNMGHLLRYQAWRWRLKSKQHRGVHWHHRYRGGLLWTTNRRRSHGSLDAGQAERERTQPMGLRELVSAACCSGEQSVRKYTCESQGRLSELAESLIISFHREVRPRENWDVIDRFEMTCQIIVAVTFYGWSEGLNGEIWESTVCK